MEEQSTLAPQVSIQRWIVGLIALGVVLLALFGGTYYWQHSDPYVKQVLALQGDAVRGNAIFQMNCAGCHGTQATGKVGPSLRGVSNRRSDLSLMHQITSGKTPPMPKFQANPAEMADLLSYLNTL